MTDPIVEDARGFVDSYETTPSTHATDEVLYLYASWIVRHAPVVEAAGALEFMHGAGARYAPCAEPEEDTIEQTLVRAVRAAREASRG